MRYWRWRNRGEGPRSYKLGRAVVYDRADVEAWLAEQKNRSSAGPVGGTVR
ncbi:MAG: helix-turn-helix transcriptional regulator [Sciscionella sp.]